MDRIAAMTVFVEVADRRGFAPAARRLGVSASAATRLVAALEDRLRIRLLDRTTRSVTLTDAGARYLVRARRILTDLAEADAAAAAELSVPTGRFVVAAPRVFGRLHVAPVISALLARHPAVTSELVLSDRMAHLVEDGIDAAVRIGALEDSSLVARKVGETRRVVVAAPSYLARRPAPRTPRELAGHDIIQFTTTTGAPEWRFVDAGGELKVGFAPRLVTNSVDAALGHAERGGGLATAFSYQVVDAVAAGRLCVVLDAYEPPPSPISIVYSSSRLLSANIRSFVELVGETCDWRFTALPARGAPGGRRAAPARRRPGRASGRRAPR
jgi:DNA-binding transcriptional LysR family regulator